MNNMLLRAMQPSQGGVGAMPTPNLPPGPQGQPSFGNPQSTQPQSSGGISPNMLNQWLQLYDQQMGPTPTSRGGSQWVSPQAQAEMDAASGFNARGARMNWALAQMQRGQQPGQMPDFFAGVQDSNPQDPQAGYNRLAQLMGRR